MKTQRLGLIYACSIAIIYSYKRHISKLWNQNELNVINKTKEIAIELMRQVKKDLKKLKPDEPSVKEEKQVKKFDGISYLDTYVPHINTNTNININISMDMDENNIIFSMIEKQNNDSTDIDKLLFEFENNTNEINVNEDHFDENDFIFATIKNYDMNYNVKQLITICDYYGLTKDQFGESLYTSLSGL